MFFKDLSLRWAFFLCFLSMLLCLSEDFIFPLHFFAPFLVFVIYQKSFLYTVWTAFFCGGFMDLMTATNHHLGVYALNYVLTVAFLYRKKQNFFPDYITTFLIMSFLFSLTSNLFSPLILWLVEAKSDFFFHISYLVEYFFRQPLYHVAYTFIIFELPMLIYLFLPKKEAGFSSHRPR